MLEVAINTLKCLVSGMRGSDPRIFSAPTPIPGGPQTCLYL